MNKFNEDYYYELKYVYNDKVVTHRFNGDVTMNSLVDNLKDFVKSAGWSDDSIKGHLRTDEDIWNEEHPDKEDN